MPDGSITRPAGPSGPRVRAALKQAGTDSVKESFAVSSVPWRVDRSYIAGDTNSSSVTDITQWPLIFGLPSIAPASSAIVLKRFQWGISSNGVAGRRLYMQLWRAYSPTGGTLVTPANYALKMASTNAESGS